MASAYEIAYSLGAKKMAGGWICRCPSCNYASSSFSISEGGDGKALFHCFAGCDPEAVMDALRSRGLWAERQSDDYSYRARGSFPSGGDISREVQRSAAAAAIWRNSRPAPGTLVETYLQARGLSIAPPPTLRFHPSLKHRSGDSLPAMVALVSRSADKTPQAVHRTFLARDGSGKAPVLPAKMMLGDCSGRAARLGSASDPLILGEGIESVLSAMQLWGLPGWAALSSGGLSSLAVDQLPEQIIIAADCDRAGIEAAYRLQQRLHASGRQVRVFKPASGNDFNDHFRTLRGAA